MNTKMKSFISRQSIPSSVPHHPWRTCALSLGNAHNLLVRMSHHVEPCSHSLEFSSWARELDVWLSCFLLTLSLVAALHRMLWIDELSTSCASAILAILSTWNFGALLVSATRSTAAKLAAFHATFIVYASIAFAAQHNNGWRAIAFRTHKRGCGRTSIEFGTLDQHG